MNAENPVQIDLFGVSRQAPKTRRLAEHIEASLCQVVRDIFFEACDLGFLGWVAGAGRSVGLGPGVASPKSWCSG